MIKDIPEDRPRPESVAFLKDRLVYHDRVVSFKSIAYNRFEVTRLDGSVMFVHLSNIYSIGVADYHTIRTTFPETDCIVTASQWNRYSSEAKELAMSEHVGLFKIGEFLGALNRAEFWTYLAPEEDDSNQRRNKRGA